MSKTALALAAYQALARSAHSAYRETKHVTGTVARRGWRPYIPWCFGALLTAIVYRVWMGLPLPDAATLAVLLGPLGAITAHAIQVRSGDYRAGVANAGGAFNSPGASQGFA